LIDRIFPYHEAEVLHLKCYISHRYRYPYPKSKGPMKICYKYLGPLFALFLTFESCKKQNLKKEVVYHNYSLKQLRGYLSGDWITNTEKKKKNKQIFWRFIFRSDSSGTFQNYEYTANGTALLTCAPGFKISAKGSTYNIKFTPMFSISPNKGATVTTITDRKLVMIDRNDFEVYEKINRQK
jgi:hypothetical protein